MLLKKYNYYFSFLLLYRYKYLFSYLYRFILKKKSNKLLFFFYIILHYYKSVFSLNFFSKNTVINYSNYNTKLHNLMCKKKTFSSFFSFSLLYENSYFFWYLYNNDYYIKILINVLTKDGKKFVSYKNTYKIFNYIKKWININPIFIVKKALYKNRFLFDIFQLKFKKKTVVLPKMLSLNSQVTKSIRYLINDFNLSVFKLNDNKKVNSFSMKIAFSILNNVFNEDRLKKLILKESFIVKNNFYHIKKENFSNKYMNEMEDINFIKKKSFFKKKFKSFGKKDKFLKYKYHQLSFYKDKLEKKKKFLFGRFQLSFQSKIKLKSKWF